MIPAFGIYPRGWPEKAKRLCAEHGHRCERCFWAGQQDPSISVGVYHLDRDRANAASWNEAVLCPPCQVRMRQLSLVTMLFIYNSPGVFGDNEAWLKPHMEGIIAAVDKMTRKQRRLAGKLAGGRHGER